MNPLAIKFEVPDPKNFKNDIPASLAVFFIAVPICLGIAHASGAPLFSGLITGIIGGIVVGFLSSSQLSVSGPAAGLTAICIAGISGLGSFEAFLTATILAGAFQVILGFARAGSLANYIPNTVIKGMLSAIGLTLILKQLPHIVGYDIEEMGVEEFEVGSRDLNQAYQDVHSGEDNSFTVFFHALTNLNKGVLVIGLISLLFLIIWDKKFQARFRFLPGSLFVVLIGVLMNAVYGAIWGSSPLGADHFVNIPSVRSIGAFRSAAPIPDLSLLFNMKTYATALTIAVVASVETLLSIEAIEKLDPLKRNTNSNQELLAQGIGNMICGFMGGLPMTSVIVRGSVNVEAGAKSKHSAIIHGGLIALAVVFFASWINLIPLSSLAAILVYTGYKLFNPGLIIKHYKQGAAQLIPFVVTILAITLTDLLIGVMIGIAVAIIFIAMEDYKATILKVIERGSRKIIILGDNINFLHKPKLIRILDAVEEGSTIEFDGSNNNYIDKDILDVIKEFKEASSQKNIEVILGGIENMDNNSSAFQHEMDESYERLFRNNKKWIEDRLQLDPDYFKNLTKGQAPKYLFIGCSDSRVPANEITGTEAGEMFVQRNIANMVVHTDVNLMSVLQYSIEILNVKHVIVCGHYGCGGVKAAMEDTAYGLIDKWLRNIKDVYRLHKEELDSIADEEQRHRKMVELNVREQVYNLMKTSYVQKNRKLYGFPQVHGWVYDIADGHLIDMKIDMQKDFPEFDDVYKIF